MYILFIQHSLCNLFIILFTLLILCSLTSCLEYLDCLIELFTNDSSIYDYFTDLFFNWDCLTELFFIWDYFTDLFFNYDCLIELFLSWDYLTELFLSCESISYVSDTLISFRLSSISLNSSWFLACSYSYIYFTFSSSTGSYSSYSSSYFLILLLKYQHNIMR